MMIASLTSNMSRQTDQTTATDRLVRVIAAMVVALGLSVLAGWAWDIDTLKRVLPGMNTMKPNSAVGFMLVGAALFLMTLGRGSGAIRGMRLLTAALTMLLGLVTLSEYILGWNSGLDRLLFHESAGRMSALTAACFMLLGTTLLFADLRRGWTGTQIPTLAVGAVSLLALGGNMFGDPSFPNLPGAGAIAIHTAAAFLLVAIGFLTATSHHGVVAQLRAHLLSIGFWGALAVLIVASIAVYVGIERRQETTRSVERSYAALLQLESASSHLLQPTPAAAEQLMADLAELRRLTVSQNEQQQRLAALEPMIKRHLAAASLGSGASDGLAAQIGDRLAVMQRAEQALVSKLQNSTDVTNSASFVALAIALMLVLMLLLMTFPALQREITGRKRSEAALRRSEERYTLAAQIGRSGAWEIWPAEGKIFFDGNLTRLLGYQAHELSENLADWVDTVPEHARAEVAAAIQAVIEGRADHYTLEHPVRRKDGSIGWVYVQGQRVSQPGETPLRLVGSSLDISERKRAEVEMDRSNTVLNAVNHAQSLFIAKRKAAEIFNGLLDAILQLTESEYGFIGEVRHTEDGRPYIKAHGITNIAWNDETRRFFEESAPAGLDFFKLDNLFGKAVTQRQVIIANDPAKDPRSAGVPEGHPAIRSFMGVPFFEGDEVLGVIALANRPDGYAEDLLPVLQPLLTASKNILGSLRVEQQRVAAEATLQRLNDELEDRVEQRTRELIAAKVEAERASLAKSDFLSRMSHELRTPMNAILGFSQLLESDPQHPLAEIQRENVQEILHAGGHLLDLINEVLDLARIESGKFTVSQEPVPLMPLISDCLALIRPQAEARGIRIIEAGRDCGEHVLADRVRLKQVLLNLLSNAVKYNRAQGTLSLVCMRQGDAIQIRISDTGAGLSAEQQARLFVAFERLDADKTAIEGTGIGLALSKRLVELMHGEIGVESTPGSGSTFWVRLPLVDGHAEDSHHPGATASEDQVGRPDSHKQWDILCIEDNPANLRLIERILARRSDIRLLTASAPGLGLELAVAHRPTLILLDINLPDMDGYDVMQCLRENPATRDIPVVAISANAMPKDLARGKAAGFVDYLTKPLAVERLLRVVDAVIATGSSTRPREGAGHE